MQQVVAGCFNSFTGISQLILK